MNHPALIFLGTVFSLVATWYGFVFIPQTQIGRQQPVMIEAINQIYPGPRPGQATQGLEVYRANGCVYCHSQQVRGGSSDLPRWGQRRTVAQDYLYDLPVQLGSQRLGPDLANIGLRQSNAERHYAHLYLPSSLAPGSTMPPYKFLFEKRIIKGALSPEAVKWNGISIEPGYEIIPKPEAVALVAYLLSLRADVPLFEAPLPNAVTNAPAAATVGSATNSPPK